MSIVSNPATASTNRWKQLQEMAFRGLTRPCHNLCIQDLPEPCKSEFDAQGYKNPDQRCKEAWKRCMRECIRLDLADLIIRR